MACIINSSYSEIYAILHVDGFFRRMQPYEMSQVESMLHTDLRDLQLNRRILDYKIEMPISTPNGDKIAFAIVPNRSTTILRMVAHRSQRRGTGDWHVYCTPQRILDTFVGESFDISKIEEYLGFMIEKEAKSAQ